MEPIFTYYKLGSKVSGIVPNSVVNIFWFSRFKM